MNEANPFQAPQEAEELAAQRGPSRPKPWSAMSLLATLMVLAFVGASWWFVREPPFTEQLPNQWSPYFDQVFVGINLLYLQAIVLGFWLGGGSTPILLRSCEAVLLLCGLGWETVQLLGSNHWEVMIRIALAVATLHGNHRYAVVDDQFAQGKQPYLGIIADDRSGAAGLRGNLLLSHD